MTTFVCLIAIFIFAVDAQLFPSLLGQIQGTSTHHGLLLAALFVFFPLSSAVAGYAADRIGKRGVLALGAVLMAVPFVVAATVNAVWAWIATAALFGMGGGIVEGQSSALLSDSHPGRERWAISISQTIYCVGAAGGPLALALAYRLVPGITIEHTFVSAAVLSVVLLMAILSLRDTRARAPAAAPVSVRALLQDREWLLLCLALFLYVGAESCTAGWLAKYGTEVLGMGAGTAPLCIAVFWGGLGVSRAATAALPARVGTRALLLVSLVVTAVSQVVAFSVSAPWAAMVMFGVMGAAMGGIWPAIVAHAGSRYRHSSGAAVGIVIAAGGLAIPVIQPLLGWLSGLSAIGLRGALLSLTSLTLINILVVLRLSRVGQAGGREVAGNLQEHERCN